MGETLSEYFQRRGSLGVIIVLKDGPHRFTDLADALHISDSTLTKRLGEARDLGLIVPEMDEQETSVEGQYRITERGQYVVGKLEQLDVVHAYRTFLDMYHQIEDGTDKLVDWVDDERVKAEFSRKSETDPYIDPFGYNVTEENPDRRYE
jgi:DNA-binding HxlR family transcriptional regulator